MSLDWDRNAREMRKYQGARPAEDPSGPHHRKHNHLCPDFNRLADQCDARSLDLELTVSTRVMNAGGEDGRYRNLSEIRVRCAGKVVQSRTVWAGRLAEASRQLLAAIS